jgi:phospholipid/cholesterol/gamma-HCH transport system permease protein
MLKTLLLALAVSLIPAASAIDPRAAAGARMGAELQALVRLFLVMLLIEVMSLVGNYG